MPNLARIFAYLRDMPERLGRVDTRAYIPELDGLRCLAILFVLVWHSSLRAARYIDHLKKGGIAIGDYYSAFPHGEIGVILFFFISGFVVSQPFVNRPRGNWKIGEFYKRRFLRIYPPYLIAMTICFVVLGIVGHAPADANAFKENASISLNQSFLASLVYLHGIVFNAPSRLNPPMWSLEIEVLFYALLPVLMLAYCRLASRPARIALMVVIIALAVTASSLLITSTAVDLRLRWGLFYHGYLFLMGVVVADLVGDASSRPAHKRLGFDALFFGGLALIVGIGLMMTQNDARMPGSLYALKIQAMTIVAILLIFYGAFHGRIASALLSRPWVRFIGTMCYSLYLTHIVVMTAAGEVLAHVFRSQNAPLIYLVYIGVLVGASLVVGCAFYVGVERPFARRLAKPKAARAAAVKVGSRANQRDPATVIDG